MFANPYMVKKLRFSNVDEFIRVGIVGLICPEDMPAVMQRMEDILVNGSIY
jgi:aspartate aminotransferase-like enzyme